MPRWLVVLLLPTWLAPPAGAQRFDDNPWWHRRVLHIAHAGGECEAPTNTLYAFKTALAKGVDMLEFDVNVSADGVPVVIHDATVDRVTDGSGRVDAMTLVELKRLDKAYDYRPHAGEGCVDERPRVHPFRGVATGSVPPPAGFEANDFRIATVREVLEAFPDVLLSIEIKGSAPAAFPTSEALAALLREFGRTDDVLVASFDDAVIDHFKAHAPEVHTTPGTMGVAAFIFGLPVPEHQALQLPPSFGGVPVATPSLVAYFHSQGMPAYVFLEEGTEFESVYDELLDAGIDGVITGRPSAFEAKLQERGLAFETPIELPGSVRVERADRLALPLACPFWAGSPVCAGRLHVEWMQPGGLTRSLVKPLAIEVPRAEILVAEPRLAPRARALLRRLAPLEARVRVEPSGPLDATTEVPLTLLPKRELPDHPRRNAGLPRPGPP